MNKPISLNVMRMIMIIPVIVAPIPVILGKLGLGISRNRKIFNAQMSQNMAARRRNEIWTISCF